jgi:hypothetical protein
MDTIESWGFSSKFLFLRIVSGDSIVEVHFGTRQASQIVSILGEFSQKIGRISTSSGSMGSLDQNSSTSNATTTTTTTAAAAPPSSPTSSQQQQQQHYDPQTGVLVLDLYEGAHCPPDPLLGSLPMRFHSSDLVAIPEEFARQMNLLEHQLYQSFTPMDCLLFVRDKKGMDQNVALRIKRFITHFNKVS